MANFKDELWNFSPFLISALLLNYSFLSTTNLFSLLPEGILFTTPPWSPLFVTEELRVYSPVKLPFRLS